ncbi:hypothetical protein JH308_17700 [Xanthomonas campestris pv. campestris]|uniref:P-loop ATPase, Sll1717 family n=1 Tax=Xanthomonas campestris TaxID=339 RepID=UPI00226ADA8F|nr:hypothetical protein [Xanthomonas campestris]MEB1349640.1 hypothetical protein [Xanthomonas campestris pv. campestris]WDK49094.1 hypothetical protein JH308_17700 [Xanthomonas campestris pv. campestris]WDK54654.1 hypothetical protein JH267_03440 [Xanthomonas campestris pv. campestris]WDL63487.1 hypothetical protein JH259_03380 [Xanthomonas campestris pv. campestris]WDL67555.1 hypothetical protein JH269_02945 [Xanthomonas campestris pv. campestris]
MVVKIDLLAAQLFGNEAAEDEEEDVFWSNLMKRDDLADFDSHANTIKVVSAYKGEGKSSLLRALGSTMSRRDDCLVVKTTGSDASPDIASPDSAKWAKAWRKGLFNLIAAEVGATIGVAWNDDSMALVEEAEKQGFRRRSIVSAIVDRITPSLNFANGAAGVSVKPSKLGVVDSEGVLKRFRADNVKLIWLVIDDVDRNYRDTKQDRARIAGFFDAIRDMANSVPQLRVRTSIRPNVYASIRREFESFSHVRQYIVKISWTEVQMRRMLAQRIEGYLHRTAQLHMLNLSESGSRRDADLIKVVFDTPVKWGRADGTRSIHIPLYTLSAHRPRWVIELCKVSAAKAASRSSGRISLDHINAEMAEFGENRISDIVAEFKPQCPQLDELIDAFYGGRDLYTTMELEKHIEEKIIAKFLPNIAGMTGAPRAMDIASFLFEVGIFFGRRDLEGGGYEHISFAQRPGLLRSRIGSDDDLRWEIHPVFRQALRINQISQTS